MLLFQSVCDGRKGYALDGPYNAIHVGAAAPILPKEVQTKRFIDKYRSNNVKIPFDLVKCTHAINCNQFCFLINCMMLNFMLNKVHFQNINLEIGLKYLFTLLIKLLGID